MEMYLSHSSPSQTQHLTKKTRQREERGRPSEDAHLYSKCVLHGCRFGSGRSSYGTSFFKIDAKNAMKTIVIMTSVSKSGHWSLHKGKWPMIVANDIDHARDLCKNGLDGLIIEITDRKKGDCRILVEYEQYLKGEVWNEYGRSESLRKDFLIHDDVKPENRTDCEHAGPRDGDFA